MIMLRNFFTSYLILDPLEMLSLFSHSPIFCAFFYLPPSVDLLIPNIARQIVHRLRNGERSIRHPGHRTEDLLLHGIKKPSGCCHSVCILLVRSLHAFIFAGS